MTGARNNLGAETRVSYAPSTRFYVADEQAGTPWVTRLPFPVQVVERVETIDWIGRNRLVSRYAYHHGYFDGYEREFRGFGMVEQWDTEEFRADTALRRRRLRQLGRAVLVAADAHPHLVPHRRVRRRRRGQPRSTLSEYWTEPALRAPGRAADAAAMRLPDTVLPDGLSAARGPGGLPRAEGPRRCGSRSTPTTASAGGRQPLYRHRAELHHHAASSTPARTCTRCSSSSPRETAVLPLRARP